MSEEKQTLNKTQETHTAGKAAVLAVIICIFYVCCYLPFSKQSKHFTWPYTRLAMGSPFADVSVGSLVSYRLSCSVHLQHQSLLSMK